MIIKITDEKSSTSGFISWSRLATELLCNGELKAGERITHFEVSERGIKFFVSVVSAEGKSPGEST